MHTLSRLLTSVFLAVLCLIAPSALYGQSASGSIAGVVTDAATGAPLAGANVLLDGTPHITATDRTGAFRLSGVPAGDYNILVLYIGHTDQRADVKVSAGQTVAVEVKMPVARFSETVQVRAQSINEGQASALNQQKTAMNIKSIVSADQIGSFPDPNAAEAASRIPGVSISRDQGEGRYILIRGTEARLNSVMIDGERIPAPEGDTRQVQMDAVPADQLQSIEVSKAVTPDMDADSIGGAVNLITRQAVSKPTALFSLAGGYNALQSSAEQLLATGTVGRRFGNGRFGLLVGGSSSNLTRGSENFEATYSAAGALTDLQLRDYQITRSRNGLNLSADAKVSDSTSIIIRGMFNRFEDYEVNNRERFRPANSRIEHVLKNRNQYDEIKSLSGTGQHVVTPTGATVDYKLSWAESMEDQPDRLDTIFRQTRITFAPNVSATSIDPRNIQPNPSSDNPAVATLNAWETEIFKTTDRDITGQVNARFPVRLGSGGTSSSFLKLGAKVRDKRKDQAFSATVGTPLTTVPFPQLQDSTFENGKFLSYFPAVYPKFPGIDAAASRALFGALPASRVTEDREGDAQDYTASERVLAGYAMAEMRIGNKLLLLPGVRYESTKVDYTGYNVIYDDGGDYASTNTVTGGATYGFLLPGFHVRYALDGNSNVRAAYTRTLARPNYYDLVPYQIVFQEDGEISRGNSSLKPTTSDNVDVLFERYFQSVGALTGGVFYKKLHDYVYPSQFRERIFGDTFDVLQPQNGEAASLWGMELAFQNRFRSLPSPFDGLGILANYTLTDSSARFPGRAADATLPGQSAHIGNFAVSYEKAGFSGQASWNFHGKYIDAVGSSAVEDVYYDNRTQLDLALSQRLMSKARAYVNVLNLTNAPLRYYQGTPNRPIQEEYYRWWATFGVKLNF